MSSRGSIFKACWVIRIVPVGEQFIDGGGFDDIAGEDVSA